MIKIIIMKDEEVVFSSSEENIRNYYDEQIDSSMHDISNSAMFEIMRDEFVDELRRIMKP